MSQWFLVVNLKSPLPEYYCHHHDLVNRCEIYVSQITTDRFACRTHIPVLSAYITYHRVWNKINTMCATGRSEAAFSAWNTGANPLFNGVDRCLVFCVVFYRPLFVLFDIFYIVSPSIYCFWLPVDIFKLFFTQHEFNWFTTSFPKRNMQNVDGVPGQLYFGKWLYLAQQHILSIQFDWSNPTKRDGLVLSSHYHHIEECNMFLHDVCEHFSR